MTHDDSAARLVAAIRDAFTTLFPKADTVEVSLREEQIVACVLWADARVPETWTYDVLGEDDEVLVFHSQQGRRRKTLSIPRPEGV